MYCVQGWVTASLQNHPRCDCRDEQRVQWNSIENSLLKELEMEHQRASVLVTALNSAKQERDAARRDAEEAALQLRAAQQAAVDVPRVSDGSGGVPPGLPRELPVALLSLAYTCTSVQCMFDASRDTISFTIMEI